MTNRGIITAALILGACIIFSVWLPIHYKETRRIADEHAAACEKYKASLDDCVNQLAVPTDVHSNEVWAAARNRCRAAWRDDINLSCYGIDSSKTPNPDLFK